MDGLAVMFQYCCSDRTVPKIAGTAYYLTQLLSAGDGAGILLAIPQGFFIRVAAELNIDLPPRNYYGIGMVFLPSDVEQRQAVKTFMDKVSCLLQFHGI